MVSLDFLVMPEVLKEVFLFQACCCTCDLHDRFPFGQSRRMQEHYVLMTFYEYT